MTNTAGASQPSKGRRYGSSFVSLTVGAVLTLGLAILLLWNTVLVRIPPGHVGVLYRLFGGGTETAVKQFQAANGLTADGIVGPDTLKALVEQLKQLNG